MERRSRRKRNAAPSTFSLNIYNRTHEEIVVRWFNENGTGSASERLPGGGSVQAAGYVGMTLIAAKAYDEYEGYASLTLSEPTTSVHFTSQGGGYGKGRMEPEPVREEIPSFVPMGPPRRLSQKSTLMGQGEDGLGAAGDDGAAPLKEGGDDGGGEEEDEGNGMVYVPGLGNVPADSIPPEVRRQMMMRAAQQQDAYMRQYQQQQQQMMYPQRQDQIPPLPQYHDEDESDNIQKRLESGAASLVERAKYYSQKYILPLVIVGVILLILYWIFTKQQ